MKQQQTTAPATSLLSYVVLPCSLGQALIACTQRGVAAVLLGDDSASLQRELAQRYPKLALQATTFSPAQQSWADVVLAHLQQPQAGAWQGEVDFLSGTAFQQQVWNALRGIPAGQTRSYSALAAAMGQPRAVRAVASACGANPLAVLVPCHRVLRSDGGLGGYRWGLERKRQLLEREGVLLLSK